MTDGSEIRRLEVAVALIALAMAVGAVVVALDALRFHAAALLTTLPAMQFRALPAEGLAILGLAAVIVAAVVVTALTVARQSLAQRSFIRRLHSLGATWIDGREVVVVRGATPAAFCAGILHPRIYVSEGTLRLLDAEQLRAVVAHEAHHADRRDPLRLLVATAVTSPLRVIPPIGTLGPRHAILAELAADAAAVRSLGSPRPLARALLAFDDSDEVTSGVAPERVDQLLGDGVTEGVPAAVLGMAALGLLALTSVALALAVLPAHPELPLGSAPFCLVAVSACASPAWLAMRRLRRTTR